MRDQFYSAVGSEVHWWLKKCFPLVDIYELTKAADMFADAEGKTPSQEKRSEKVNAKNSASSVSSNESEKDPRKSKIVCHG